MSDAPGEPAGGDSSLPAAPLTRREAAEARRDTDTEVVAQNEVVADTAPDAAATSGPLIVDEVRSATAMNEMKAASATPSPTAARNLPCPSSSPRASAPPIAATAIAVTRSSAA